MVDVCIVLLVFLWLTGAFFVPVGSSAVHLLLVIVFVLLLVRGLR